MQTQLMNTLSKEQVQEWLTLSKEVQWHICDTHTRKTRKLTKMITIIDFQGYSMGASDRRFFKVRVDHALCCENLCSLHAAFSPELQIFHRPSEIQAKPQRNAIPNCWAKPSLSTPLHSFAGCSKFSPYSSPSLQSRRWQSAQSNTPLKSRHRTAHG